MTMTNEQLAADIKRIAPFLPPNPTAPDLLIKLMPLLKHRAQTLLELVEAAKLFIDRPAGYDEKARAALMKGGAHLPALITALEALAEPWEAAQVKAAILAYAASVGAKPGEVMPPIRAALFGTMSGPDIPDALAVLGKTESLRRLQS
jgi:glutamyl-tRNA synthetase